MPPSQTPLIFIDPQQTRTSEPTLQPTRAPERPAINAGTIIVGSNLFGIETDTNAQNGKRIKDAIGAGWVRVNGAVWHQIEDKEGQLNWAAAAPLEATLKDLAANGLQPVLIVRGTPSWAQQVAGSFCGPVKPDKLVNYALFIRSLASRYSAAPFNVKYWEIGNEPDVSASDFINKPDVPFGCMGDAKDEYYGGGTYAELLKIAYSQIKEAAPTAFVMTGGLLLDCDPQNPPKDKDCKPARFIEGVLKNGGALAFDGISFHAYDYFEGKPGVYSNANWNSRANATGPVVAAKARYLKEILAKHSASGKFLINTETALICFQCPDTSLDLEISKAYYVAQSSAAAWAEGLSGNIWYSFSGWEQSGLQDAKGAPTLAYQALTQFPRLMQGAFYNKTRTTDDGVRIYEFKRGEALLWVAWSLDGANHPLQMPTAPKKVTNALGVAVPQPWTQINGMPIVIEF